MLRDADGQTHAETRRPARDLSADAGRIGDAPASQPGASRRRFLGRGGLAAMGAMIGGAMPFSEKSAPGISVAQARAAAPAKGPQYLKFPGKDDGLVVLGDRPLVAETPESLLDDDTTPTAKFYIRNNGQIPDAAKDPGKWKITIDGEVNNTVAITLGELKQKYQAVTR